MNKELIDAFTKTFACFLIWNPLFHYVLILTDMSKIKLSVEELMRHVIPYHLQIV